MVFCGPNSVGKSNLLGAVEFAFRDEYSVADALDAIPRSKSGPRTLIQVTIEFTNVPREIRDIAPSRNDRYEYTFRLSRKANIYKRLNNLDLDQADIGTLAKHFFVTYVPATRDPTADDGNPLQQLIERQIYSGRTKSRVTKHLDDIKREVKNRADATLSVQNDIASSILGVNSIGVSTDRIELRDLHQQLALVVKDGEGAYALAHLGSGHQNVVLINLFRQLAASQSGHAMLLIEEPDAHLHPPIIRAIGDELLAASKQSQIFLTTHSSTLINHIGLERAQYVALDEEQGTYLPANDFVSAKETENLLMRHGIRLAEALFSKLVILGEGISDATLLSCLAEKRWGRSLNALDVLLVPINGKAEIPKIAGVLERLGVAWVAIMDFDAAYEDSTLPLVDEEERTWWIDVMDSLDEVTGKVEEIASLLDHGTKRGRNAKLMLEAVREELEQGAPQLTYLDGSVLERLFEETNPLSSTRAEQLERALRNNRKRSYRPILASQKVILLNPDLEHAVTSQASNLPIVEKILRRSGVIKRNVASPCTREYLVGKLHSLGTDSIVWERLIAAIEEVSGFSRTEVNACMKTLEEEFMKPLGLL